VEAIYPPLSIFSFFNQKIAIAMLNYSKIKNIIGILGLFALTACGVKSADKAEAVEEHTTEKGTVELNTAQFKAAQITLGNFEKKNLSEVVTANGYTKLPPQNQAEATVLIGGNIRTISVIEGQAVKAGQILATYQSLEYNNLRLQKAKLIEELQIVTTNKGYLELEFARQKELNEENVGAKKNFQKVTADLELERGRITTLQQQIAILDQNLAFGGNGEGPTLAIKSPISGYVTAVNIKIGSNVQSNTPLFSIVDNSKMHVDLLVYEKDLFKVKQGQKVRFVLTNQNNQEIMGTIFSIGKAFQNDTKAVAVHADIDNKAAGLISGMYVNALIDVGKNEVNALPLDAVVKAEGKEFIFIETEEKSTEIRQFKRVEVKMGIVQLGFVQVTPLVELPIDAKIVSKGAYYLQSTLVNSVE
jgi:membrane fusion protein, heavy metal efflux system